VNWDPKEQTVLANEQVIDGRGWRSGELVERKLLNQWYVKVTRYQDELLDGLNELSGNWPSNVLKMQENWIGRSDGCLIHFQLCKSVGTFTKIDVFTTRPDTIFGASFIAISFDHPIAEFLSEIDPEIFNFVLECRKIKNSEQDFEKNEKKGMKTGLFVSHPFKEGYVIPVYIANFVLMEYGTGAVFGCPSHDCRDYEFAKKYDLDVIEVVESSDGPLPYIGDGVLKNSDFLNGLDVAQAKKCVIKNLELYNLGKSVTVYRLRDWLISRQRYWGCPIPIIHCPKCGIVPMNKESLPLVLPDDVSFDKPGNPLESHRTWKYVNCPKCGENATRETDTLDTFFESSWYFLRYLDPNCKDPFDKEVSDIMLPVDLYIGGVEHSILHLLYARFFMLALRDLGYSGITHPFKRLLTQGMVCHRSYKNSKGNYVYPSDVIKDENGNLKDLECNLVTEGPFEKMSKSKKNVVSPQDIIESHGSDAVRLFIISDTPPEKDFDWNTDALDGSLKFIKRVWNFCNEIKSMPDCLTGNESLIRLSNIYVSKIEESINSFSLNKYSAFLREFFNEIEKLSSSESRDSVLYSMNVFVKVFYPACPHVTCEIYQILGNDVDLCDEQWPVIDKSCLCFDEVTVIVQVNGKLKRSFQIAKDSNEKTLEEVARNLMKDSLSSASVKKVFIVKNKIVNFVV
jgi:leucyl-tRNA synthetase